MAHAVVVTPGRCGLYETTRELVKGLRERGVDSRMVDPTRETNKLYPKGTEDRGALFADMEWGVGADILVSHSGYDGTPLEEGTSPVVHVAHGRPRSSFLSERDGSTPIYSYHYKKNQDPRLKAVVTFWKEHVPFHEVMFPEKRVHYVPSSVDLDAWSLKGPSGYKFGGKGGKINVVCADAWRDDLDPFYPVNAFALWARWHDRKAKLHVYGGHPKMKGWGALFRRLQDDGTLGELQGWVGGLANVYRAADVMITPQEINTRSVREAMACGLPVVRVGSNFKDFGTKIKEALDANRKTIRQEAEEMFNPTRTAARFHAILQGL